MKLPWWLYVVGAVLLAVLGWSYGKEKELERERKRTEAAIESATLAQQESRRKLLESRLARIDADLRAERRRPVSDRIRDLYLAAKQRQGADPD